MTAQTISVPEPSTLIGLGVLGLLTLRKKSF
ncbi:PEP-CTERM sorting domain-containing protein [Nostoc flagelliforme]